MFTLTKKRIATIIKFLKHHNCTEKLQEKFHKKPSDKAKYNLAKGCLENWNNDKKLKKKFKSIFLQGGLCSTK